MSGSAKAGTTAERHKCELRMLANADVRAPPKRASGGLRFPLTKTYMDVGKPEVGSPEVRLKTVVWYPTTGARRRQVQVAFGLLHFQ